MWAHCLSNNPPVISFKSPRRHQTSVFSRAELKLWAAAKLSWSRVSRAERWLLQDADKPRAAAALLPRLAMRTRVSAWITPFYFYFNFQYIWWIAWSWNYRCHSNDLLSGCLKLFCWAQLYISRTSLALYFIATGRLVLFSPWVCVPGDTDWIWNYYFPHRLPLERSQGNVFTTKVNITRWFSFLGTRWMFEILQPAWKTSTTSSKTTWRHSSWGGRPVTCVTFVYLSGCLFHWWLSSDSQNTDVIIQMFDISFWGVCETGSVWSM